MKHLPSKLLVMTGLFYGHLLLPAYAGTLATELPTDELIDLDIESLMDMEVYSASKKTQRLKDVSSAVFVINQDMIHNSGLTEIPELLRLAPGVQVSRINGNAWSVSIRGGSGRYGDKLLVMIDGRSIYTLLYAGVYWENQDMVLDDIERIEVIRGPGATLWGANAVNGVINIITKKASETQGGHVAVSTGTINKALIGVRYGGSFNDDADYRLSLKYRDQAQLDQPDGAKNHDGSNIGHGSFRSDWAPNTKDNLTFQGGFYNGTIEESANEAIPTPPYAKLVQEDDSSRGWNILGSWNHQFSNSNQLDIKFYYDTVYRDSFFYNSDMDSWDLELQQQLKIGSRQDLTYGFRYRYTDSDLTGKTNLILRQNSRSDYLYSFFIQDDISLLTDKLILTLGSKFEDQSLSDFEVLPTARLLWKASEDSSLWASVSRAVRSPSIGEQDIAVETAYMPINGDPAQLMGIWVLGNPDLEAEQSISYEAGYRTAITPRSSLDLTIFYTTYDDIRGYTPLPPNFVMEPVPHLRTGLQMANNVSSHNYGFEISGDWRPLDTLSLHANYSYLQMAVDAAPGLPQSLYESYEDRTPNSLYSISANWKPQHSVDLGMAFYGSSKLDQVSDPTPAYLRCDLRVAWRPVHGVELSLVGQNLLDSSHSEFPAVDKLLTSEIPRSVYLGATFDF